MVARRTRRLCFVLVAVGLGCFSSACSGKSVRNEGSHRGASGSGGSSTGGSSTGGSGGTSGGGSGAEAGRPPDVECHEGYECPMGEACDPATGGCVAPCGGKVFDQGTQRDLEPVVPCPESQICIEQHLSTYTSVGACFTPCDSGACPEGFSCFAKLCLRAGGADIGGACDGSSTATNCRGDALCFQGACRARCDFWGDDPVCARGEACWNGLASGGSDDSLCIAPDVALEGTDPAAVGEPCAADSGYSECGNDGKAWRGRCDTPCPFSGCSTCAVANCDSPPICLPICRTAADCPSNLPVCNAGKCVSEGPPGP